MRCALLRVSFESNTSLISRISILLCLQIIYELKLKFCSLLPGKIRNYLISIVVFLDSFYKIIFFSLNLIYNLLSLVCASRYCINKLFSLMILYYIFRLLSRLNNLSSFDNFSSSFHRIL
jgi:hypothetical protein